jgi:hypothetical protein
MTYEEILIEAAAVNKACKIRDREAMVRRFGLTQIINALPEEQRIEAHKTLFRHGPGLFE